MVQTVGQENTGYKHSLLRKRTAFELHKIKQNRLQNITKKQCKRWLLLRINGL